MKIFKLLSLAVILCSLNTFAQEPGLIKLYKMNSGKEKMVKFKKIDDVELIDYEDENINYQFHIWTGDLVDTSEDSLFIHPYNYNSYTSYELENGDSAVTYDQDFYLSESEFQLGISKSNIKSLSFTPKIKYGCWVFSYLSLTSALVVAPILSIKQFNKGTFNTTRYINVAKYSLLGALVSGAISFAFPTRNYTIEPKF